MVDWQSCCLMRAFMVWCTYVCDSVCTCVRVCVRACVFVCSSMDVCVCMSVIAFKLVPYSSVRHAHTSVVGKRVGAYGGVFRISRRCDNIYTYSSSSHLW